MPLNISDAADAYLIGDDTWSEFITEFQMQWFMPMTLSFLGAAIQAMPPEMLEKMREINPDTFVKVMTMLGGLENAPSPT